MVTELNRIGLSGGRKMPVNSKESRSDALRDALEDQIVTGELPPGSRLEEIALAERFGVSRTPIRQALFQLAATGLVEHRPRRGAFVADIGLRRLSEMFEVIAELEALCAGLAARRATVRDVAEIRETHATCARAAEKASEPDASSGESDTYYYANEQFHQTIHEVAGNEFLLEQISNLQKRLKAYRRIQLRARDRVRNSLEEHSLIFRAIEAGSVDEAASAMRNHVAIQGDRFADLLSTMKRIAPRPDG
jgi:DNA-binding GntR family transcriptional regulator